MDQPSTPPVKVAQLKRPGVYATVIFAAFVLGFVPMWLAARTRANERDVAQQALRLHATRERVGRGGHSGSTG